MWHLKHLNLLPLLSYLGKSNFLNLKNERIRNIAESHFYKNFCWRDQGLGMAVNPAANHKLAFMSLQKKWHNFVNQKLISSSPLFFQKARVAITLTLFL